MSVVARDVVRRFRNGRGVGPVSLEVHAGETAVLMGPNGAGKTTLLHMLATASRPATGLISWFGSSRAVDARRRLGFAGDTMLEEGALTARQTTHFWCSQWLGGEVSAAGVSRALRAFALDGVADEPIASFSFGMRRRLLLAQAFAHMPTIVLLDEPTAGLDPEGVEALRRVVRERAGAGAVTIIASNDCSFAVGCDRVIFLDGGHVVRDAAPESLLTEVGGTRRADLELAHTVDLTSLRRLRGVGGVDLRDGTVSVELQDDAALALVVAAADAGSGNLRSLRLRTPDLSDSFRRLTGHPLHDEGTR